MKPDGARLKLKILLICCFHMRAPARKSTGYLKKYALKEVEAFEDIYFILKRKGRRRVNPATLPTHLENVYNWAYWDQMVNQSNASIF